MTYLDERPIVKLDKAYFDRLPKKKYRLVRSEDFNDLEETVSVLRQSGWSLFKSPLNITLEGKTYICQAMIGEFSKFDKPENERVVKSSMPDFMVSVSEKEIKEVILCGSHFKSNNYGSYLSVPCFSNESKTHLRQRCFLCGSRDNPYKASE